MSYHLTPVRMVIIKIKRRVSVGEGLEKRELLYTANENVNQYSRYRKEYGNSSEN